MDQLTKEQAACVTAVTGMTFLHPKLFLEEVSKKLGRKVHPSEFNNPAFIVEVKNAYHEDFIALCVDIEQPKLILPGHESFPTP